MKQTSRKAKALLLKFKNYSDEELIDFVVEKQQGLDDESLEVIQGLLQTRGYELQYEQEQDKAEEIFEIEKEPEYQRMTVTQRLNLMTEEVLKNEARMKREAQQSTEQEHTKLENLSEEDFLEVYAKVVQSIIQKENNPEASQDYSLDYFKQLKQVANERHIIFPEHLQAEVELADRIIEKNSIIEKVNRNRYVYAFRGICVFFLGIFYSSTFGEDGISYILYLTGIGVFIINFTIVLSHWVLNRFK